METRTINPGRTLAAVLAVVLCFLAFSSCRTADNAPVLSRANISEDTKFKAATVDISIDGFNELGFALGDSCDISFSNGYTLTDVPYFDGYYVKNGAPVIVAYPSSQYLSITLNNVGIWDTAGLTSDCTVTITLNTAKKYLATQEALGQSYSLKREDYGDDEEFSNFRSLSGGNLKDGLVYRGASPVDDSRKRAACTDGLLRKYGIAAVIDLADSDDDMKGYFGEEGFSSAYTKALYENGKVITLSMGSSYASDSYRQSVVSAFRYMLTTDGPYYIHCMEGKDRTGFVCCLLEALAGADYDEMRADYMKTYENYYKIFEDSMPEKYNAIVSLYFDSFMECLTGAANTDGFRQEDIEAGAREYLRIGGMSDSEIDSFIGLISK